MYVCLLFPFVSNELTPRSGTRDGRFPSTLNRAVTKFILQLQISSMATYHTSRTLEVAHIWLVYRPGSSLCVDEALFGTVFETLPALWSGYLQQKLPVLRG